MNKIWYIFINGQSEGPLSVLELKKDLRLTPDTLVWKEGFTDWKKIRDVAELKELFKDEPPPVSSDDPVTDKSKSKIPVEDEIAIDYRLEPPYLFWLLVAAVVVAYAVIQLFWK